MKIEKHLPAGSQGEQGIEYRKRSIKLKNVLYLFFVVSLLSSLVGCEAFVRKFTRKPKTGDMRREEMVLVPQEYKGPQMSKEELYRKYFMYWQAWQGELINAMAAGGNYKKRVDSLDEAIKNLGQLKGLLNTDKQKQLDVYLQRMYDLRKRISDDIYSVHREQNRFLAERLTRDIQRYFSYSDIKNNLI